MDGLDGMWHVIVTSLVEEGERQREKVCVCVDDGHLQKWKTKNSHGHNP